MTDGQKVKVIEGTVKRAQKLATKAGRANYSGGDIVAAKPANKRSDVRKEVSIADVAALTEKAVCATNDTADDIATIAAWLEAVTTSMTNRDAARAASDEKAAAQAA